ncbi:uncharacterized protein LOC116426880, partial [Nomia melanderi]|uniref:uncharacterized protein LOC116426880 n=1 Tax=Nomia melanderi TaxID=2448451 RepID=UPI003FCD9BB8
MQKQRERKEKLKHKDPVEYYLPDVDDESQNITATTVNPKLSDSAFNFESPDTNGPSSDRQPDRLDQGEDNVKRLNQRHDGKETKTSDDAKVQTIVDPMKYVVTVDETVVPGSIDDIFNDFQFIDQKNDRVANDVKPLYEELKTVYDWSDDQVKIKPRIKGDQRLHCEPNDKVHPAINVIVESPTDQTEDTKLHDRDRISARSPREHVQNLDREKQTIISSRDLHESFVEPSGWIDDLDEDALVRLSRGLKTVERFDSNSNLSRNGDRNGGSLNTAVGVGPMDASSAEIVRTAGGSLKATLKPETSELGFIVNPASDLRGSREEDNARVRREATSRYETFYDDANEHLRNSESMDYNRYPEGRVKMDNRIQLSSSRGHADSPDGISSSNTDVAYDYSENLPDYDYYAKVVRSAKPKKREKHKKKKKRKKKKKHKKRKKSKSKYSGGSRKRRHRKKQSNESKTKDHDRKKQKKRVSKTVNHRANVKKSGTDQSAEKVHGHNHRQPLNERKRHRKEMAGRDNADGPQRKMASLLLAADNVGDESQMDSALHGELPGKIVEQIFSQVQKNEDLKVSLGPGLHRNYKTDDAVAKNKRYRQALDENETKHTKELMDKVMLLLNRLVFDEVERKTCMSLPPDLVQFLDWMLEVNPGETPQEQVSMIINNSIELNLMIENPHGHDTTFISFQLPSLPLIHSVESVEHFPREKFLFQANRGEREEDSDVVEMHKKLRLIESLIKEYKALSEAEKSKVQSVHDYLASFEH